MTFECKNLFYSSFFCIHIYTIHLLHISFFYWPERHRAISFTGLNVGRFKSFKNTGLNVGSLSKTISLWTILSVKTKILLYFLKYFIIYWSYSTCLSNSLLLLLFHNYFICIYIVIVRFLWYWFETGRLSFLKFHFIFQIEILEL